MLKTNSLTLQRCRQYLLAFTLLLSFFAIPGYVNSNRPLSGRVKTEALAGKHASLKSSISYKRVAIVFYKVGNAGFTYTTIRGLILRHQQIAGIKYRHRQHLFSNSKSALAFCISTQFHSSRQGHPAIA